MNKLDYSNINYFIHTEPRMNYIKVLLESILSLVELEKDGRIVEVDGFRLKNIEDWLLKLPMSPLANLGSFSGYCNCRCQFCLEEGNPGGRIPYCKGQREYLSMSQVKTRLKYFDEKTHMNLPRANTLFMEPFMNPHCLEILSAAKKAFPNNFIWVETNGTFLKRDVIRRLSDIGVDEVLISLNSATPEIRKSLMRDNHPEVAIEAVRLLRDFKIPFTGSVVPWPSVAFEDLEKTIRYLDENEALSIRIYLPAHTKFHPPDKLFDEKFFRGSIRFINGLRNEIRTPIIFIPSLYVNNDNVPRIIGVIKNSPADKAGIKPNDIILGVESFDTWTHFEANYYMKELSKRPFRLRIDRDGKANGISIQPPSEYKYPYTKRVSSFISKTGIVMHDGFQLTDIRRLVKILVRSHPKKVLFLSTKIMKPLFKEQLKRFCEEGLGDIDFRIEVPEHRFWGGNIFIGGIYMVSDFVECAKRMLTDKRFVPDLIIIPSSPFSEWGKDIMGEPYAELERRVGIPVEILRTQQWLW